MPDKLTEARKIVALLAPGTTPAQAQIFGRIYLCGLHDDPHKVKLLYFTTDAPVEGLDFYDLDAYSLEHPEELRTAIQGLSK